MRWSDAPCEVDRSTGYMKLSFGLTVGKYKIDPITIRLPEDLILKIWNAFKRKDKSEIEKISIDGYIPMMTLLDSKGNVRKKRRRRR